MMRIAALVIAEVAVLASGCGDESCGPLTEAALAIPATIESNEIVWENWRSSPNNDCGEAGGPISLTVEADQVGSSRGLTLCLPRPDKLSGSSVAITESGLVQIIDVFADTSGVDCLAALDRTRAATGTLAFPGLCDEGLNDAGYSLSFDINIPMTITCGAQETNSNMVLEAVASVQATPQP